SSNSVLSNPTNNQKINNKDISLNLDIATLKNDRVVTFRIPEALYDCLQQKRKKKGLNIANLFRSALIDVCNKN
ncbi:hypothetical protein, partial [Desulfonauticus submarinus]